MEFQIACRQFLEYLAHQRKSSSHTVEAYRRDLQSLADFAKQSLHEDFAVSAVTITLLRGWLSSQLKRGLVGATIRRQTSAVRHLFRFLRARDASIEDPTLSLASPKIRQNLPTIPSAQKISDVLDRRSEAASIRPNEAKILKVRDQLILELLYSSGLRVSELVSLNLGDIDAQSATARVMGKGKKERIVPIGTPALKALAAWLAVRSQIPTPDPRALVLSRTGQRMPVRRVQDIVRTAGIAGESPIALHPHLLRHACATHMLEGGADLQAISEMLGHASLATTQKYTHVSVEHLLAQYDGAHPLARNR